MIDLWRTHCEAEILSKHRHDLFNCELVHSREFASSGSQPFHTELLSQGVGEIRRGETDFCFKTEIRLTEGQFSGSVSELIRYKSQPRTGHNPTH